MPDSPFLQLAIKPVLTVTREQLQKAHDQRPGQTEQRGAKGHAHALQLRLKARHEAVEHRKSLFALLRVQAADCVDDGRGR